MTDCEKAAAWAELRKLRLAGDRAGAYAERRARITTSVRSMARTMRNPLRLVRSPVGEHRDSSTRGRAARALQWGTPMTQSILASVASSSGFLSTRSWSQWIASASKGESVIPMAFCSFHRRQGHAFSLRIYRQDPVFTGSGAGLSSFEPLAHPRNGATRSGRSYRRQHENSRGIDQWRCRSAGVDYPVPTRSPSPSFSLKPRP